MSTFSDRMKGTAWGILSAGHGETVTHYAGGTGEGVSVTADIDRNVVIDVVDRDDGTFKKHESELSVSKDDVSPAENDKWTFDSKDWDVIAIVQDVGIVTVRVVSYEKLEDADGEYRAELP